MDANGMRLLYDVMVRYYGCDFRQKTRRRSVSDKKAMFAYIARKYGATYSDIQKAMGWKNHSSCMHGEDLMEDLISADAAFNRQLNDIMNEYEFRQWAGILV